jgi:opacity protein-like surface antigen
MRTSKILWTVACFMTTPAYAVDGSGYVGLEGGILLPRNLSGDIAVTYPSPGPPQGRIVYDHGVRLKAGTGYDVDAVGGYDFGTFRVEGELGYKHSHLSGIRLSPPLLADLSTASGATPALTNGAIDLVSPRATALSAMINGLVDFGAGPGVGAYAGGGIGEAHVKRLTDGDTALAWQLIAGVRVPISANIEAGLKYRYFNTGRLRFHGEFDFGADGEFPYTTSAKFRSHSLLASLIYNFGSSAVAPPPPPPPMPAPPPPAAPATQTCPDGSVILAASACPPPPPPPPPAPVERGW